MSNATAASSNHKVVSHEQWLAARKDFLAKEKDFTHLRDELSRLRRELPWEKVGKDYVFDSPSGKVKLADLFGKSSQLAVYHFMLGPGWKEGCPSCSYLTDHFGGPSIHLPHRDVALVLISRAPQSEIESFKKRMGWKLPWYSSFGTDFNMDFGVSFPKDQSANSNADYNYAPNTSSSEELPGLSVFFKDDAGNIFHTYSAYARGLDILVGSYNFLDLMPKGRDEAGLKNTMAWVRHHDKYESA